MHINECFVKDLHVLSTQLLLDCETPISLYQKIRHLSDHSFLLESVEEGNSIGRYSIIGWGELKSFVAYPGQTNTFAKLKEFLADYKLPLEGSFNGCFGYLGYESVYDIEPTVSNNPLYGDLPIAYFFLPKRIVVFDKLSHQVKFIFNIIKGERSPAIESEISAIVNTKIEENLLSNNQDGLILKDWKSNVTKEQFESIVKKSKEYIASGDVFQVVMSQRFSTEYKEDPLLIYRYLCSLNPSPYMFYFNFANKFNLLGTSPEIMLKKTDRALTIRPIAGTRWRGKTAVEDAAIAAHLLADEKENAEHLMLVDLARNDLNRICKSDTVKVEAYKNIEKYSHVMHIVSSVTGQIQENKDTIEAIKASFPAGTLSGAPKVRAMQIIRELENFPRQTYGGMVGYFDFAGNFDSCITIRSVLVKDKVAFFQAGAGIVADSDPSAEYEESVNKAKAMLKAITLASGG